MIALQKKELPFAICCRNFILGNDWFLLSMQKEIVNGKPTSFWVQKETDLSESELTFVKKNKSKYRAAFVSKDLAVYERTDLLPFKDYFDSLHKKSKMPILEKEVSV